MEELLEVISDPGVDLRLLNGWLLHRTSRQGTRWRSVHSILPATGEGGANLWGTGSGEWHRSIIVAHGSRDHWLLTPHSLRGEATAGVRVDGIAGSRLSLNPQTCHRSLGPQAHQTTPGNPHPATAISWGPRISRFGLSGPPSRRDGCAQSGPPHLTPIWRTWMTNSLGVNRWIQA